MTGKNVKEEASLEKSIKLITSLLKGNLNHLISKEVLFEMIKSLTNFQDGIKTTKLPQNWTKTCEVSDGTNKSISINNKEKYRF